MILTLITRLLPDCYQFYSDKFPHNPNCSYRFTTRNNIEYTVYFIDVVKIIDVLDSYPVISNAMYMGIELITELDTLPPMDANIGLTISEIFRDYIDSYGRNIIVIYNCDERDGKQEKRHIKFNRWFNTYLVDIDFATCHKTILTEEEPTIFISQFLTFLYANDHSRISMLKKEIEQFEKKIRAEKE